MNVPSSSAAERRYFERVAEDCERLLGPGIELRSLELDQSSGVVLRLRYALGKADWTTEGRGDTVIEAHAALREKLVLDRIRIGVRALYKERKS
ncbi:MAG TPA: hypothetical protein VFN41_04970 [Candidatus Limnocylindrales bacterium]|nr:hypothetical protein [Candidatus Limnocylindrales bacterium]